MRISGDAGDADSLAQLPKSDSDGARQHVHSHDSISLSEWLGSSEAEPVHVVPCANGTDALQAALMALGLQPGDEVITPSFTYIATVEVIQLLRLTPVMVDVDPHTFTIDPFAVEAA